MEEVKNVTVYYSETSGKNKIDYVSFQNALYGNFAEDSKDCELQEMELQLKEEHYKKLQFTLTAQELKDKKNEALLLFLAQKAQEELAKLGQKKDKDATPVPPPAPPAAPTNGIAAASNSLGNKSVSGYSLHYWMDQCRTEINAKLNPAGHSLPEKSYDIVTKDGHKIKIEDNGNMAADLKSIDSMNEQEFADFICKDLKAYVNMFKAMHEKHKDPVFPENKINLFVIKKEINTPEGKAKIARIEKLVAQEMHTFLKGSEFTAIKDKFTILGRAVDLGPAPDPTPAPAPAPDKKTDDKKGPKPSAPPAEDENTPPDSGSKKLDLSQNGTPGAPPAGAPPAGAPPAAVPPARGSTPPSPRGQ